jgi:hypothetical protein
MSRPVERGGLPLNREVIEHTAQFAIPAALHVLMRAEDPLMTARNTHF